MYYSGKKKKHTLKTQLILHKPSKKIISTSFSKGKTHDFKLFKLSKNSFHPQALVLTDSGYKGLQKIHANTLMPRKRFKKKPLSREDKQFNKTISSLRVFSENVFSFLKRFKIIADRYRNRRKRFALRFSLVSAIYNYELSYVL